MDKLLVVLFVFLMCFSLPSSVRSAEYPAGIQGVYWDFETQRSIPVVIGTKESCPRLIFLLQGGINLTKEEILENSKLLSLQVCY